MVDVLHSAMTGHGLDAAHTCTAGALADDLEHADLSSIAYMAAAAELHGEAGHGNHANNLAIFFSEERHSTLLLSFLNGQLFNLYALAGENLLINNAFYLGQLCLSNLGEMGEVKAQSIGANIAAGLVYMAAQHLL